MFNLKLTDKNSSHEILAKIKESQEVKATFKNIFIFNLVATGFLVAESIGCVVSAVFKLSTKRLKLSSKVKLKDDANYKCIEKIQIASKVKPYIAYEFKPNVNLTTISTKNENWHSLIRKHSSWEEVSNNYETWEVLKGSDK